jgi:hypothetical protein
LLKLFLLDRALREVVHELVHRPDLADVPLRALLRIVEFDPASADDPSFDPALQKLVEPVPKDE